MAFPTDPIYKLYNSSFDGNTNQFIMKNDGVERLKYIPKDTDNSDYQDYLKWVSEGGVAEAAD